MPTIVVRSDLPHDECVSDVMEKLVDAGVPHEVAAYMAESVVGDFERHKSNDEMLSAMAESIKQSRVIQRLHLWGISVCVALALTNGVLAWHYWTEIHALDIQLDKQLHQLLQRPPLHNQKDS